MISLLWMEIIQLQYSEENLFQLLGFLFFLNFSSIFASDEKRRTVLFKRTLFSFFFFFFFFFFRCRSRSRNQNFEYELDYQWSQTTLIKTLLISISAIMSSAEVHVRIRGRPKYKKVEPLLSSPQWGVWSERLPLKWLFYIPNPSRDQDKKRDPCLLQRLILQPVSDSMSLANDTIAKNKVSVKKLKVIGGKLWTMRNQRSACSGNVDQKWTASKETSSFLVAIRVHFARRVQSTNFFRFNNRLVFTIAINWSRSMMRNRSLSLKKKKS